MNSNWIVNGFSYPFDYLILSILIVFVFLIANKKAVNLKKHKLATVAILINYIFILVVLYFTFDVYISSFPWAPHYEPLGLQYLAIIYITPILLGLSGILNYIISYKSYISRLAMEVPFLMAIAIPLPLGGISDGRIPPIACYIGAGITACSFVIVLTMIILELKNFHASPPGIGV